MSKKANEGGEKKTQSGVSSHGRAEGGKGEFVAKEEIQQGVVFQFIFFLC